VQTGTCKECTPYGSECCCTTARKVLIETVLNLDEIYIGELQVWTYVTTGQLNRDIAHFRLSSKIGSAGRNCFGRGGGERKTSYDGERNYHYIIIIIIIALLEELVHAYSSWLCSDFVINLSASEISGCVGLKSYWSTVIIHKGKAILRWWGFFYPSTQRHYRRLILLLILLYCYMFRSCDHLQTENILLAWIYPCNGPWRPILSGFS
jgi:hypothetical protein